MPSAFLDDLQRLPGGANTILFLGGSTMQQKFCESICSLVRHFLEHVLDNPTSYEGVIGPPMEVKQFGAAGGSTTHIE